MSPDTLQVVSAAVGAAVGGGGAAWVAIRTDVKWLKMQVRELRNDVKQLRERAAQYGLFL